MKRGSEPAYAQRRDIGATWPHQYGLGGLTIREAFVMAAMQGLCANASYDNWSFEETAATAIKQADATLAALEADDGK